MPASPAEDPSSVLKDDPLLKQVPEVEGYKVLEPCVLYAKVGEGGMGAVYRGRHLNLDIDVAIKCLKNVLAEQSPAFVTRFQREARIAASVHHQNLVQVYDISEKNGVHYLVMEYVRGETARERVSRKKRLRETEALKILFGAASGLAEAHGQRIVHRDIKPDNILISYDGKVKVSDLGLAKALEVDAGPSLTQGVMGTPQYMAPEQWEDSAKVGPPADVWALGATFYYLLTGEHAISGGTMQQIFKRICVDPFPSIQEKLPSLSAQARAVLERCTRRDPAERFSDCRELVRELSKFVAKDAPGPEMVDLESGTTYVPPLLSPPPAETLGHIRVALSDVGDKTMQVATPATGSKLQPGGPPAKPPVAAPAGAVPTPQPGPPSAVEAPVARRNTTVMAGIAGILAVVGVSSWFVIDRFVDRPPRIVDAGGPKPALPTITPLAPTPVVRLKTSGAVYVGSSGVPEFSGTVENATSTKVWLANEREERMDEAQIVQGSFTLRLKSLATLLEGSHNFSVRTDGSQGEPIKVICDRTNPKIELIGPPTVIKQAHSVLGFTVRDDHPGEDVPIVEAEGATVSATTRVEGSEGEWQAELDFTDGQHSLTVSALDLAGNLGKVTFQLQVVLVQPPALCVPDVKIIVNADDPSPDSRTLSGSVSDAAANAVYEVWIEDEHGSPLSKTTLKDGGLFQLSLSFLSKALDGTHSFMIKAEKCDPILLSVVCDRKRPVITPISHAGLTSESPYVLSFRVNESVDLAWVEVVHLPSQLKPYDAVLQGDEWRVEIPGEEGDSTLTIYARDSVGNIGRYPTGQEPFELRIDTRKPEVQSADPSGRIIPVKNQDFKLFLSEEVSAYQIDGSERVNFESPAKEIKVTCDIPNKKSLFSIKGSLWDLADNEGRIDVDFEVDTELVRPSGWDFDPECEPALELNALGKYVRRARRVKDPATNIWFLLLPNHEPLTYIAETEITREQWQAGGFPLRDLGPTETTPITRVTWDEASRFCEAHRYELPSPELWRFACLAGATGDYCCSLSDLPRYAWFRKPSLAQVRSLAPNEFGLYDMHGNVWEWCKTKNLALGGSSYANADDLSVNARGKNEARSQTDIGFRPAYFYEETADPSGTGDGKR